MKVRIEIEAEFQDEDDLQYCTSRVQYVVDNWSIDRGELEVWYRGESES